MGRKDQDYGDPDPFEKTITEPVIEMKATIHQEFPPAVVEVLRKQNLKIQLDKAVANRLIDQRPGMLASDGCISSPSGPGC
jgi:hypothetical protein